MKLIIEFNDIEKIDEVLSHLYYQFKKTGHIYRGQSKMWDAKWWMEWRVK